MNGSRTLTVFTRAGLGNRLRVLLSGKALAEASGRTFTMIWPRSPSCGAAFRELFTNDWPVIDVDRLDPSLRAMHIPTYSDRKFVDLLLAPEPHIVRGTNAWLIFPDRFPAHTALATRCGELMEELEPQPAIAQRIAAFRAGYFRPLMVGVHARRGDFVKHRPDRAGNTAKILAEVDRFLTQMPEAGILLSSDDGAPAPRGTPTRREGVREIFRDRYGARLVGTAPRSLDRRAPESIQDALVDLLLLRATDAFVGTTGSSFSQIATLGRTTPWVNVEDATSVHRWVDRLARVTGIHWLARRIVRAAHGVDTPFPTAFRVIQADVEWWLRRLRRAVRGRGSKMVGRPGGDGAGGGRG